MTKERFVYTMKCLQCKVNETKIHKGVPRSYCSNACRLAGQKKWNRIVGSTQRKSITPTPAYCWRKKERMNIRQGDVLFSSTDKEVSGKSVNQLTIAEGEFTGHHHVLIAEAGSEIIGDKTHFTVKGKAKLVHPEHGTLEFGSGNYVVSMEREFDYIDQTLKAVRD